MDKIKKTIKLKYTDFWSGFIQEKCIITELMRRHYNLIFTDNPDYVICSIFGDDYRKYDAVRIFYSGENYSTDLNEFDYGLDFDNYTYNDRHFRLPLYLLMDRHRKIFEILKEKHLNAERAFRDKTSFCSLVTSHPTAMRADMFNALSKYKQVDSGGSFLNNTKIAPGAKGVLEFESSHKFSIAFEHSSRTDYITEKLVQSFAACTIPIYWGADNVDQYFNPDAMIICRSKEDIPGVIEKIKELDQNDKMYLDMLKQPAIRPDKVEVFDNILTDLEKFLCNIFDQDIEKAYRRSNSNYNWKRIFADKETTKKETPVNRLRRLFKRI